MEIELGSQVKDKVTGFSGIAVSRHIFLNGCVRYSIQPQKLDKDGKIPEEKWFDEGQLVVVGNGVSKKVEQKKTGGPVSHSLPKGLRN